MRTLLIAVALVLIGFGSAHAAVHQYRLDGSYADDYGGPSLVAAGGTLAATDYTFGPNQGLSLTGALASGSVYTIELQFRFTSVSGYRKVIDFKGLDSDQGLYVFNEKLVFYSDTSPGGTFPANTYRTVVITRGADNVVRGYVNGVLALTFLDSSGDAIFSDAGNLIEFFKDDSGPFETSSGTVNYIRTYDEALSAGQVAALQAPTAAPVPEPATIVIWSGLGICGFVLARRKAGRPA